MSCSYHWQSVIQRHLPRSCWRHLSQIHANITAVDSGIRPSYLFDHSFVIPTVMEKFVQQLYEEGLTSNQLDVISVDENVFITRITLLLDHLEDACNEDKRRNILVDVSKHLKSPVILTDIDSRSLTMSCLESISNGLNNSGTCFKSAGLLSASNVTTVFGLLLGYPVVYWYSNKNMDDGNCLDMVPVRVVKVFCTVGECEESRCRSDLKTQCKRSVNQSTLIFSWSYPDMLSTQCYESVVHWQESINSAASKQKSVKSLIFRDEVVTSPVLTM